MFGLENSEDFRVLLAKTSARTPFTWVDQEGACQCSDWHVHYHKQGRSRWAVDAGQDRDQGLEYSTATIDLNADRCSTLVGSPYCPAKKTFGRLRNAFAGPDARIKVVREGHRFTVRFAKPISAAEFRLKNNDDLSDFGFSYRFDKKTDAQSKSFHEISGTIDPSVGLDMRVTYQVEDPSEVGTVYRQFKSKSFSLVPVTDLDSLSAQEQELAMTKCQASFDSETSDVNRIKPSYASRTRSHVEFEKISSNQGNLVKVFFADSEESVSRRMNFSYSEPLTSLSVYTHSDSAQAGFQEVFVLGGK